MIKSDKPLAGLNILVTRARSQAKNFSDLLTPLGAQVRELPVLEIKAALDFAALDKGLHNVSQGKYDWLIFASKNAVDHTIARALAIDVAIKSAAGLKIAAIGPATQEQLAKNGLAVDFCPSGFLAELLVEEFPGYPNLQGIRVLWPKTNIGRTLIADKLSAAGAVVDTAIAYLTELPAGHMDLARQLVDDLAAGKIDVITLASAQSARNLAEIISLGLAAEKKYSEMTGAQALKKLLTTVKIAAIGPITANAARENLGKVDIEATEYTLAGLTDALLASLKFGQKQQ